MTFTFQKYTKKQKTVLSAVVAMVAITVVLIFSKCFSDHQYSKILVSADSLCDCNPDSAVVLLKKIKLTSSMDEADSMYCELLKIKASNNLYEIQKDSTIFRIVEFFDAMGDRGKLCQAYYYQGKYYIPEFGISDSRFSCYARFPIGAYYICPPNNMDGKMQNCKVQMKFTL